MDTNISIVSYSPENLASALSNKYTRPEVIVNKSHFQFFTEYLGVDGLNTKTIVKEHEYINRDYLHDYATYYSFCREDYSKFCNRIHFFSNDFDEETFKNELLNVKSNKLKDNYLGYIVVKPIPYTVIGFTLLKTYSNHTNGKQNRVFWGTRKYKINFFGLEFELDSLAFQEQDTVISACATTAIWSMLNKASNDNYSILKTPSQITRSAANISPDGNRLFPNRGLNIIQICKAIFKSGLVTEVKQPDISSGDHSFDSPGRIISISYLKKIIRSYSTLGIPVILIAYIPTTGNYGLHAITVSGYSENTNLDLLHRDSNGLFYLSDNITKIYSHDDQWGPFARITFTEDFGIETPWSKFDDHNRLTYVKNIIVPIYPKVRISFEDIEALTIALNAILDIFFKENKLNKKIVWDIKLEYGSSIRSTILSSSLSDKIKLNFVLKNIPKYLWNVYCYANENKIFHFTIDATDVNNGIILNDIFCFLELETSKGILEHLLKNASTVKKLINHPLQEVYFDFLVEKLTSYINSDS